MQESICNAGDLGSIPGSRRPLRGGKDNPLQYSCLENPMDREAWQATILGVARVRHDLETKLPPPWYWISEEYIRTSAWNIKEIKKKKYKITAPGPCEMYWHLRLFFSLRCLLTPEGVTYKLINASNSLFLGKTMLLVQRSAQNKFWWIILGWNSEEYRPS